MEQEQPHLPEGHELLIALCGDAQQRHIGLLVRDEEGRHHLLHLAWHWSLRWEPHTAQSLSEQGYQWHETALSAPQQLQIAERCIVLGERIVARDPDFKLVGYGITLTGEGIDPATMRWRSGPDGAGRTCATYVLDLLEGQGVRVLRRETWPANRAEDHEWQTRILDHLEAWMQQSGIDGAERYLEFERQHIGQVARFRPEEVAAAAIAPEPPRPLAFEDAVVRAAALGVR